VVPLTTSFSSNDELLGGGRAARPVTSDPIAIRVLTKGEPIGAPSGRADDFTWPRNNVVTAEPGATPASTASAPAATPAASTAAPPRAGQATTSSARRANAEGPAADADAPAPPVVRKRPRPPAADTAPRPPLGIGPPPSSQGWNGWRR
jgi:hypothetical protein